MSVFIAQIGYTDYLIQSEDAAKLLEIASRSKALDRSKDYKTYHIRKDAPPFVTMLSLGDISTLPDESEILIPEPIEKPF